MESVQENSSSYGLPQFTVSGDRGCQIFLLGVYEQSFLIVGIPGCYESPLRIGLFLPDGLAKTVFQIA